MTTGNTYRGFDEYAARLIKNKARQMVGTAGYTPLDQQDLEQELMVDLINRLPRFNPAIAKKNTFMIRVVEHRIATIYESRRAGRRDWRLCQSSLNSKLNHKDGDTFECIDLVVSPLSGMEVESSVADQYAFQIDFKKALGGLPEDLQDLCMRLKVQTLTEIAQELDVPRTSLYSKLRTIKNHFAALHMDEYLNVRHPSENSGKKAHSRKKRGDLRPED